jgi:hypothetical protein
MVKDKKYNETKKTKAEQHLVQKHSSTYVVIILFDEKEQGEMIID